MAVSRRKLVRILLVDDDEVDVMAVQRAFTKTARSNPLQVASDGREALSVLRGESGYAPLPKPYMILLDLCMPKMNGLEFLRELRNDPVHKNAVVFVVSSSTDREQRRQAYNFNIAGYLMKSDIMENLMKFAEMLGLYCSLIDLPQE